MLRRRLGNGLRPTNPPSILLPSTHRSFSARSFIRSRAQTHSTRRLERGTNTSLARRRTKKPPTLLACLSTFVMWPESTSSRCRTRLRATSASRYQIVCCILLRRWLVLDHVSTDEFYGQQLLDVLHSEKHRDLLKAFPNATRGKPGCAAPKQNKLDASKARSTFGWEPIPTEQTVVDMTRSLAERQKEW